MHPFVILSTFNVANYVNLKAIILLNAINRGALVQFPFVLVHIDYNDNDGHCNKVG